MCAMTTHKKRTSAVAGVTIVLVALLAGCSSDPIKDFCNSSADSSIEDLDFSDPANFSTVLKELEKISPPAEIKDDWNTTLDAFEAIANATEGLEADSEEFTTALMEAVSDIDPEQIETSATNVSTFIAKNCEA